MRTIAVVMSTTMCAMLWSHVPVQAEPVGTSFTYQGQLKLHGVPLSDYADFRFSVWNAHLGGQQVGLEYQINGVTVDSGLFTARVDVGADVFTGDARWLQVAVRYPTTTGSFIALAPRQLMTPTPYTLFSDQTRGIFASNDGTIGIGEPAPLDLRGASELRDAVASHDPVAPGREHAPAAAIPRRRSDRNCRAHNHEVYGPAPRRSADQNEDRRRDTEMVALRDRPNELELLMTALMEAQTRHGR